MNKARCMVTSFLLAVITSPFLFLSTSVSASDFSTPNGIEQPGELIQSNSIFVRRTATYSRDTYSANIYDGSGKKPIPQRIWVSTSGGYAGYIGIEHWEIGPTHFVVTYSGNIPSGPYSPTKVIEEEVD